MNKLKLLSTSILCSLSTMGFAEDWDGKNDQLKAWNTASPKVNIIADSLYTPNRRAVPQGMTGRIQT